MKFKTKKLNSKEKEQQYQEKIKLLQAQLTSANNDVTKYQNAYLEISKELEIAAKERIDLENRLRITHTHYYNAVRAYNGLCHWDKAAKELGIDTSPWILPEHKPTHEWKLEAKLQESGKVKYSARGKPLKNFKKKEPEDVN